MTLNASTSTLAPDERAGRQDAARPSTPHMANWWDPVGTDAAPSRPLVTAAPMNDPFSSLRPARTDSANEQIRNPIGGGSVAAPSAAPATAPAEPVASAVLPAAPADPTDPPAAPTIASPDVAISSPPAAASAPTLTTGAAAVPTAPAITPASAPVEVTETTFDYQRFMKHRAKALRLELTAAEMRAGVETAITHMPEIFQHLNGKTMKELAPNGAGSMTKKEMVNRLARRNAEMFLPDSYQWDPMESLRRERSAPDAVPPLIDPEMIKGWREAAAKLTDARLDEMRAKRIQEREREQRIVEGKPTQLSEFRERSDRLGDKALKDLDDDQIATWDRMETAEVLARRAQEQAKKAQITGVTLGDVEAKVIPTKHTKTGAPLWVVQMSERVDKERYLQLNQTAKRLNGYYSSFRGNGAVPGFTFDSEREAGLFVSAASGKAVDAGELQAERKEAAIERTGERLHRLAGEMEVDATNDLSRDRRMNTYRQADMAARAQRQAREQMRMAATLHRIADAESPLLEGIRHRADVETLERYLTNGAYNRVRATDGRQADYDQIKEGQRTPADIRHVSWEGVSLWPGVAMDLSHTLEGAAGSKRLGAQLRKLASALPADTTERIVIEPRTELFRELADKLPALAGKAGVNQTLEQLQESKRMVRMGAENEHVLREMMREYLKYRVDGEVEPPIERIERSLIGRDIPGFFPTPDSLGQEVIRRAAITPGMRVLEPSAGKGDLAELARDKTSLVDVVEVHHDLREILKAKGMTVIGTDFLAMKPTQIYDRIVMNPPFEDGQDRDHVRHAYGFLKPGGRLVSIMSVGPFQREAKADVEFRQWMATLTAAATKNPEDSFNGSDAFRKTGVNTVTMWIDRPNQEQAP